MSEEDPPEKCPPPGPGWIMTFADLMSLLLCFFVLLLSFAQIEAIKFRQLAGSIQFAFGVENSTEELIRKGTSVIALEYSPGRPTDAAIKILKQLNPERPEDTVKYIKEEDEEDSTSDSSAGVTKNEDESDNTDGGSIVSEEKKKAEQLEKRLKKALENEMESEMISVEVDNGRVIIRIRERGSFSSGKANMKRSFIPVLKKIGRYLKTAQGKIIVAGHTDNIPISTKKYRSNWELSSARAVTVLHALTKIAKVKQSRFIVEGHADTRPIEPNKTKKGRAKNRRVELIIIQGQDVKPELQSVLSDGKGENSDKNINKEQPQEKSKAPEIKPNSK